MNEEQQGKITVKDVMTKNIISLWPENNLELAANYFEKYDFDGFPVINKDKKLVGILTAYDMVSKGSSMHLQTLMGIISQMYKGEADKEALENHFTKLKNVKIEEVMNKDPLVIEPDVEIERLAKEFTLHHRVNPIPVVDKDKKLLGVVSRFDIIKFFNEQYLKDILEKSAHGNILKRLGRLDEE